MPQVTDVILQLAGSASIAYVGPPNPGVWVRLVNNKSGLAYVSTTTTDPSTGYFTVNGVPAGEYTIWTSATSSSGPWTVSKQTNFLVPIPPLSPTAQSSAYTAADGDLVLASASGGAFTVTLPAPLAEMTIAVKKSDTSQNVVTVSPSSGTIDGAPSFIIANPYQEATFVSDGTNWWVV